MNVVMSIPEEMDPEYLRGLEDRCMERAGYDRVKAARYVEAVKRGWEEADRAWRERRVA